MKLYNWIMITGIIAFILFLMVGIGGLLHVNFLIHRNVALAALAFAVAHASLIAYFKLRR